MGVKHTFRPGLAVSITILAAILGWSQIGEAAHDLGQDCYTCHNIRSGQVWQGSYSVWSGTNIGMSPYSRPISCDVCHTGYSSKFNAASESHHPVKVIAGSTMVTDYDNGVLLACRDCHNADSVAKTPNLNPDLAPQSFTVKGTNTGYPNHDVSGTADNQLNTGDPPHLLAMRLSAGQRTVAGSGAYNKVPSSNPASDYAFCFSCHDGSNNTARGAADNILASYLTKGHYFKSAAPTGGAVNDRIPCSDCHASHNSPTNARLFEPDNTTWTGTRPSGLAYANPNSPTAAEIRALCIFCHEDYSVADTTTTAKRVRNVQPIRRKYGVTGHAPGDLQSCEACHNTHNPPAGGDDCLNCHRTGGSVQAKHRLTDQEFPADGTWNAGAGEDNAAVQVSGHKGVVFTSPYNTKALNECKKCHGTAHPTDTAKVQAADGASAWPTGFVYGLSYNGSAWSANAASFADTNVNNIIDGNEFCLSCHDGADALSPTDNANIRIGGVNPPKVWFPSGGQSTGHDRKSGSNYPVSGNAPAQQLCTSCHKYHTSDRPQLFPGNFGPFGAGGGYTYAMPTWGGIATNWQAPRPATPSFPSNAGRVVIGNVNANALNFTDRSNPSSGKGFGTAGAAAGTDGFCNACHRDGATVTAGTLNAAHTHEGTGFVKDCVECHNPHGGGATPNIAMIRQTVGRDNTTQNTVVFTARTGADSFDENDGATESNSDDLCATCHNGPAPISHNYRLFTGAANHSQGAACTSCHPHGQTDNAAKVGFPQGSCTTCHGNATNGTYWPDNTATGAAYPNRSRSHLAHITAIYNANSATLPGATAAEKQNATCTWCHPGSPPAGHSTDNTSGTDQAEVTRMDTTGNGYSGPPAAGDYWSYAGGATDTSGTAVYFKTMAGGNDNNAYYDSTAKKACSNVDCHAGNITPNWVTKERYDGTAPSFAGGASGIAATDLAQGGAVSVTWNEATDPGPPANPPVRYTLYWSDNAARVFTTPTGTMDNLAATAATVTGLTNGTTYYFGVRAKDSLSPTPNVTANTDTASAAPTALPTQYETVNWKLKKSNGYTLFSGTNNLTTLGTTCGSNQTIAAAGAWGAVVPGRGLLTTGALTCTASNNNTVSNSSPATTEEQFVAFYTDTTYTAASTVTGNASGSTVGIMASATAAHTVRVRLAGVTNAGVHTLSANTVTQSVTSGATNTAFPLDLSTLSVTVPAGGRLAVIFSWQDTSTAASTNDHILIDNNATAGLMGVVSVTQPVQSDTTPPAWTGGVSGIAVSTTSSGDSLQVTWNTATDSSTPPVKYDLYRGSSAATVFSAPTKTWTNLGTTSIVDSGLAEGTTYYYGVRAKDSVTPTPNATTNTDTASGVPVTGAPVWTGGGSGVAATDLAQGGAVSVTWNTATDGDHPPAMYTLYWATSAANVFTSPLGTMDNLATTSATVTGLTNSTAYYFGVRAKDSASPANATNNTDTATATPTAPPPQYETVNWMLKKSNGFTVYTGQTTNLGTTCGTSVAIAAAGAFGTYPVPGRGLLTTGSLTCATASNNNFVSNSSPSTTAEELVAFYTDTTYPAATTVTGNATGSSVGIMASSTAAHTVAVRLAGVTSAGTHTLSTNTVTLSVTSGATNTVFPLDLSTLSVAVPAGGRLAVIFTWDDSSTGASTNDHILMDNVAGFIGVISVSQPLVPPADTAPPVWSAGSGIAVTSTGAGDSLQASWNAATDAATPPVRYDLYRGGSAATVFSAPTKTWTNLGATSIIDSGLTEGTTYYYGVRAKDSVTPTPNVTANTDNASGVPSVPVSCTVCHGTAPATGAHLSHADTDDVYTDCDNCHGNATYSVSPARGGGYTTAGPAGLHNSGAPDLYMRANGETDAAWNGTNCTNVDCHNNVSTPNWYGGTLGCGGCHAYPPTTGVNHVGSLTAPLDNNGFLKAHDDCLVCHGKKSGGKSAAYQAAMHADGRIQMNSSVGYDNATAGCTIACHANDANHRLAAGAKPDNSVAMGKDGKALSATCNYCHNAGVAPYNAPVVPTATAAHSDADGTGGTWSRGMCMGCHAGHVGAGGAVAIGLPSTTWDPDGTGPLTANANLRTVLGIGYAAHGAGGIALGGNGTASSISARTTEAEICWGCHDALSTVVSEWGTNTDTNGAANNYNFGTVTSSDWTAATWSSGQTASPSFSYKTGAIASTHAANPGTGVQGSDAKTNIRCSYCHDVHDTKGPNGKPYLRGAWMGNPYREDGAPQSGTSYTNVSPWGQVPRATPAQTVMGGYWIDQNSGNPAGTWTAAGSAGLCELCHGNGDGVFASTEIDALNTFGNPGDNWVSGLNGHRNAVLGASLNDTAAARNIFAGRGGATNQDQQNTADHPFMLFDGTSLPGDASGGFRGGDSRWGYTPAMVAQPMDGGGWVNNLWGTAATPSRALDLQGSTVNAGYHQFPCSKCHNPHASRLPRLMITNCLDTKHNSWDQGFQVHGTTDAVNAGRSISNWSSAQNCHRMGGNDLGDTRDTAADNTVAGNRGWNKVTPW